MNVPVSFNDGATWNRLAVETAGKNRTVTIKHPAAARFVSLRATAATATGTVKRP